MSNDLLCEIKEKIEDADLVLVGIGEQLLFQLDLWNKKKDIDVY